MSDKFQNKYRSESIRLQNWDYRWNAAYFITICTHNREHYFGEIKNGKMHLSNIGILADIFWHEIKNHTKHAHRLGYEFAWQTRFYDNIIRDENAYNTITKYIHSNVQKWESDRFWDR